MERFRDIVYERIHEVKNLNVKISDMTDHILARHPNYLSSGSRKHLLSLLGIHNTQAKSHEILVFTQQAFVHI